MTSTDTTITVVAKSMTKGTKMPMTSTASQKPMM